MKLSSKISLGIFSGIGVFVTISFFYGFAATTNVCSENMSDVIHSPDQNFNLVVEHKRCSETGAQTYVLLGSKDKPNDFNVVFRWEYKDSKRYGISYFPIPIGLKWTGDKEAQIYLPDSAYENTGYRQEVIRFGAVKVKYNFNHLTIN